MSAAFVIGVAVSFYLVRDVASAIAGIVKPMQALGAGDLTATAQHLGGILEYLDRARLPLPSSPSEQRLAPAPRG